MLKLNGTDHLAEFAGQCALMNTIEQPCRLHGQGRGARYQTAMGEQEIAGTQDGKRIDTVMIKEAPVFIGQQHSYIALIDIADLDR